MIGVEFEQPLVIDDLDNTPIPFDEDRYWRKVLIVLKVGYWAYALMSKSISSVTTTHSSPGRPCICNISF